MPAIRSNPTQHKMRKTMNYAQLEQKWHATNRRDLASYALALA